MSTALADERLLVGRTRLLGGQLAFQVELRKYDAFGGEVALEVAAQELVARIAKSCPEGRVDLRQIPVQVDGGNRLARVFEQVAVALLAPPQRVLGARTFDRETDDVHHRLGELEIMLCWRTRMSVVEGEGPEQSPVGREDGR